MTKELFIDALSQDHLVALLRESLQFRADLESSDLQILNESVRDFLARNAGPFCALLNNPGFVDRHTGLTQELLVRAHELAAGPKERSLVEGRAVKAGFDDLFAATPPPLTSLTRSQTLAFEKLQAMAMLHFRGAEKYGIKFRLNQLLLGGTGLGKTHLVERLGQVLRLDVMRVTVGDWMVTGSRHEPHTLRQIHGRLKLGKKFILAVDELDKIRGNDDTWSQSQLTEIYNVLDGRLSGGIWNKEDCQQFKENVHIVGIGTWSNIWQENTAKPIGFGGPSGDFDLVRKVKAAKIIPLELINRFNSDWLVLEPLTVADFERIARELHLGPAILEPEECAASGLGFRSVENCLTEAALKPIIREIREAASQEKDLF